MEQYSSLCLLESSFLPECAALHTTHQGGEGIAVTRPADRRCRTRAGFGRGPRGEGVVSGSRPTTPARRRAAPWNGVFRSVAAAARNEKAGRNRRQGVPNMGWAKRWRARSAHTVNEREHEGMKLCFGPIQ